MTILISSEKTLFKIPTPGLEFHSSEDTSSSEPSLPPFGDVNVVSTKQQPLSKAFTSKQVSPSNGSENTTQMPPSKKLEERSSASPEVGQSLFVCISVIEHLFDIANYFSYVTLGMCVIKFSIHEGAYEAYLLAPSRIIGYTCTCICVYFNE